MRTPRAPKSQNLSNWDTTGASRPKQQLQLASTGVKRVKLSIQEASTGGKGQNENTTGASKPKREYNKRRQALGGKLSTGPFRIRQNPIKSQQVKTRMQQAPTGQNKSEKGVHGRQTIELEYNRVQQTQSDLGQSKSEYNRRQQAKTGQTTSASPNENTTGSQQHRTSQMRVQQAPTGQNENATGVHGQQTIELRIRQLQQTQSNVGNRRQQVNENTTGARAQLIELEHSRPQQTQSDFGKSK
ncbi:hypothetical protein BC940DRAFT_349972 [Gongronella butleri]|nr:hypothetical protein BC940DRAFT_349972 [Gongronella butleri]